MVYWHIIVSGDWTEACKLCLRALFRINLRSESLIAQLINTRVWSSLEVAAQAALGKTPAAGDRQTNFSPGVFAALMNHRNENVQCHDYCHLSWIRSWNGKVITKLVDDWGCCVHFSLLFFFLKLFWTPRPCVAAVRTPNVSTSTPHNTASTNGGLKFPHHSSDWLPGKLWRHKVPLVFYTFF